MKNPFSTEQWVAWLGATFVAAITATFGLLAYAHSTFVTIRESDGMEKRLDRMEDKLDKVMSALGIAVNPQRKDRAPASPKGPRKLPGQGVEDDDAYYSYQD